MKVTIDGLRRWLKIRYRLRTALRFWKTLGVIGTIQFLFYEQSEKSRQKGGTVRLQARSLRAPTIIRLKTSDLAVFREVVIDQVYDCLDSEPVCILDCGANVGYSAAFFLSRHPNCTVLSIEPDPDNYKVLCENLRAYGERSKTIQAGVWSHTSNLAISNHRYRDGHAWSRQVIECDHSNEKSFPAVSIDDLLLKYNIERISILKMDIEGAEAVVFKDCQSWLGMVDNIIIELHDDSMFGPATEVFYRAVEGQGFDVIQKGVVAVCTRTLS